MGDLGREGCHGERGRDDEIHLGCAEFEVIEINLDGVIQNSAGNTGLALGRGWNRREDS